MVPATANAATYRDPVWRAAMTAPIDATPDTEEELAAIDEVQRGGFRSTLGSVVSAEISRRAGDAA